MPTSDGGLPPLDLESLMVSLSNHEGCTIVPPHPWTGSEWGQCESAIGDACILMAMRSA
jgi:hypothetical protein